MNYVNNRIMPYLGRYARVTLVREITWELLRQDDEWATKPFTMKDFLERHGKKLERMLGRVRPDVDIERAVKGALRSLEKKGWSNLRKDGRILSTQRMYILSINLFTLFLWKSAYRSPENKISLIRQTSSRSGKQPYDRFLHLQTEA